MDVFLWVSKCKSISFSFKQLRKGRTKNTGTNQNAGLCVTFSTMPSLWYFFIIIDFIFQVELINNIFLFLSQNSVIFIYWYLATSASDDDYYDIRYTRCCSRFTSLFSILFANGCWLICRWSVISNWEDIRWSVVFCGIHSETFKTII